MGKRLFVSICLVVMVLAGQVVFAAGPGEKGLSAAETQALKGALAAWKTAGKTGKAIAEAAFKSYGNATGVFAALLEAGFEVQDIVEGAQANNLQKGVIARAGVEAATMLGKITSAADYSTSYTSDLAEALDLPLVALGNMLQTAEANPYTPARVDVPVPAFAGGNSAGRRNDAPPGNKGNVSPYGLSK